MSFVEQWELRARFAYELSVMYGTEVPAYNTLVDVSNEVNRDHLASNGAQAERLGDIKRITAERHGAIRVGSPAEMRQVARVFGAFGMYPVGFYDLRDAAKASVPVVSTAFRPVDRAELAKNPFRVFTSMLAADDPRFFNEALRAELKEFIGSRTLFPVHLLELADQAAAEGGLQAEDAVQLLQLACASFKLSDDPVEHSWYKKLEEISAVASDIGGVRSTHINHLTPRVLDIDELYTRMEARGITMIDEIQGPPAWAGPDILLRQTSFRALAEDRMFRYPDGSVAPGELRVRFGEVEQRGIALTEKGRDLYDIMVAETDRRLAAGLGNGVRVDVARTVWEEHLPRTERELALAGLAFFTYELNAERAAQLGAAAVATQDIEELITAGLVEIEPIVYEDFLPRSAAGIFQSNLTDEGSRDDAQAAASYNEESMSQILGAPVANPYELYRKQQEESLAALRTRLAELTTV
ncbi:DUF1338 domain-containing protein [Arthrobacter sp. MYb211]|nr:DUF1338 domain-containing protein [Arthrobacter sp. MYb221]PRC08830.1 DUF1338 domain-containing protein [Arthrobacter sp. MYb211]